MCQQRLVKVRRFKFNENPLRGLTDVTKLVGAFLQLSFASTTKEYIKVTKMLGRPRHSSGFPPRRPGFEPRSGHVEFVVDKVAVGQVFSEYFGFPCQLTFHRLLHIHHLKSGAGTIGQLVADVPSGLSLTPPQETKTKKKETKMMGKNV
jgi:hypothetical protein